MSAPPMTNIATAISIMKPGSPKYSLVEVAQDPDTTQPYPTAPMSAPVKPSPPLIFASLDIVARCCGGVRIAPDALAGLRIAELFVKPPDHSRFFLLIEVQMDLENNLL